MRGVFTRYIWSHFYPVEQIYSSVGSFCTLTGFWLRSVSVKHSHQLKAQQAGCLGTADIRLGSRMCWKHSRNSTCECFHLFVLLRGCSRRETERNEGRKFLKTADKHFKTRRLIKLNTTIKGQNQHISRCPLLTNNGKIPLELLFFSSFFLL